MSSEKRLIAWKIFDSEVPPLKRRRPDRASIEKSCFSTQQTQKSFSTMASDRPFRSAVSANSSARSLAGIRAILFKPSSPQSCRSEEHTSELQSLRHLVCRLLLEKK